MSVTRTRRQAHRHTGARRHRAVPLALALCLSAAVGSATATTCKMTTAGVAFGAYNVFAAAATNASGTMQLTCSLDVGQSGPVTVAYTISMSTGSSNSFLLRTMKSGANTLNYNLYTTNAHSIVWGDGTGSTVTVSGSIMLTNGNPSRSENKTVFGQVPALQDVAVSALYSDTVIVTTTY